LNTLNFKKLYNKVREIEDINIKYKFAIICDLLKRQHRERERKRKKRERMREREREYIFFIQEYIFFIQD